MKILGFNFSLLIPDKNFLLIEEKCFLIEIGSLTERLRKFEEKILKLQSLIPQSNNKFKSQVNFITIIKNSLVSEKALPLKMRPSS